MMHPVDQSWGSFAVRALVEEVAASLGPRLSARRIDVFLDIPASDRITGRRELLRRAIDNLMLNAIDAMPSGGALVATSASAGHVMELEIADSGPSLIDRRRQESLDVLPGGTRGAADWRLAAVRRVAQLHPRLDDLKSLLIPTAPEQVP